MNAQEVKADQTGDGSLACEERHYTRFLRKVLPGPEMAKGDYCCDVCGMYFDGPQKEIPTSKFRG